MRNAEMKPVPKAIPISIKYEIPCAPITFISLIKDKNSNQSAINLTWFMSRTKSLDHIFAYLILVYEEPTVDTPLLELWKHVWTVEASRSPMTCTMTDFTIGKRYYFTVRALDIFNRLGWFSIPKCVVYI